MSSPLLNIFLLFLLFNPCDCGRHPSSRHSRRMSTHRSTEGVLNIEPREYYSPRRVLYFLQVQVRRRVKAKGRHRRLKDLEYSTTLKREGDASTGEDINASFSLDYEEPRTHPPSHN
ncbi:uncharacterized protein A4U43_C08F2140 [Asparagus officinalis]|nr:uncharacterized protein A4U43_C08F2140 [Asparagus officinalis]